MVDTSVGGLLVPEGMVDTSVGGLLVPERYTTIRYLWGVPEGNNPPTESPRVSTIPSVD